MQIEFLGASEQVTGSCYRVSTAQTHILVDCGMFQGSKSAPEQNREAFPFSPQDISAIVVTHAHLDHCGRIPKMAKEGFSGKVIGTEPTLELAALIFDDAVHILGEEAVIQAEDPLYTVKDVEDAKSLFVPVQYHQKTRVGDIEIELYDAGHILGSSIVVLRAEGKTVVFSGDLGNPPVPFLAPTEYIDAADALIVESTYGARIHEDKHTRQLLLKSAIYETVQMGGVLMIPAFALERTQELLYEINSMVNDEDIPKVPIYLDSPLAIKATEVFRRYRNYFSERAQQEMREDDFFHFPGLKMTASVSESKGINHANAPKIIIAGSGMAEGGRIVHHIERYIEGEANQYLIIGYQVEGSLGRQLLDGDKTIRVNGKELHVKAKIRAIGAYSAHADRNKLTDWVTHFDQKQLKNVFVTHGEKMQSEELKRHLHQRISADIHVPTHGEVITL